MQIDKRNRAELKQFFIKNAIPTEKNFADLIDGMMNQREDGIIKLPNDPLSIEAAGEDAGQKKAIHFYTKFTDTEPTWALSLNPRQDPANPATAKAGFSIGDAAGNSRFFIDRATGKVGIGSIAPAGKLDVVGTAVISNGNGYATRSGYLASGSLSVGSINASYGGGSGWNANTAGLLLETAANTEIAVHDSGTRVASLMYYQGEAQNRISIGRDAGWGPITQLALNGNVSIGATAAPRARLDVPEGHAYVGQMLYISAPADGTNAGVLNLVNETDKKFWHITLRSGDADKLIFWRNDTVNWLNVLSLGMDGLVEMPGGAKLNGIGIGAQAWGPIGFPYESMQLGGNMNLRIYFGTTQRFILTNDGSVTLAGGVAGGQTTTGWALGRGAWGPDKWLRLTTTQLGGTYHDFAINSLWSAGAQRFDLAEVTSVRAEDQLEQGDAVVIDREHGLRVTRSRQAYDAAVYGIVSSYAQAAMVIGGFGGPEEVQQAKDKLPIALVGRVKVKVSGENGAIRVGDLLTTSSTPGHLMRCDAPAAHPGAVVGKALQPYDADKGFITALVALQ